MKPVLSFARTFPISADQLWHLVTDPQSMSRWSTAKVVAKEPGDRGLYNAVGATRTVLVPLPRKKTLPLHETIEISEPGRQLVYRVINNPAIRYHRGNMRLTQTENGTKFEWDVDIQFVIKPLGPVATAGLKREIRASLDKLSSIIDQLNRRGKNCATSESTHAPNPIFDDDIPELLARAEAILSEQQDHANELINKDDRKRWFPLVYQYVTREQIERVRDHRVQHPGWVLRLIEVFHHYYWRNFEQWTTETHRYSNEAERHWRIAFGAMEGPRDAQKAMLLGLHRAIVAHIEQDLPRALAEVYVDHYADTCSYDRFRADYLLMGDVFSVASDKAMTTMGSAFIPWHIQILQKILPAEAQTLIQQKVFYNVAAQRNITFERGKAFAETLARRAGN